MSVYTLVMTGVLMTMLFALAAAMSGAVLLQRFTDGLDPAERLGLCGLLGLGGAGLTVFLIGLLSSGLGIAVVTVVVAVLVGAVFAMKRIADWRFSLPKGPAILFVVALACIGLVALVAVLAPSVSTDWDTIAYHLAVPKLWIERGQVTFIQGMHQSNFPFTIECLFLLGLKWGGQSAAKAFSLAIYVFGCLSVFGTARRWYGPSAAWWSALAFAGIPIVAWESGTGYIDVAHGLYAALGCLFAIECVVLGQNRNFAVLAGLCLGLALGTKYTGLQVMFALFATLSIYGLIGRRFLATVKSLAIVAVLAVAVGGSWYVKSLVFTDNPVFPFFSSVFGGRDWNEWRASVYTNEQKSFGVGARATDIGHAVLGLAYQPGRYTNPGQGVGAGFPTGSVGFAVVLVGVSAALFGRLQARERLVMGYVALGLTMWFLLSQQSRYLTIYMVPLAVLAGGQVARARWKHVLAGAIAVQCIATVIVLFKFETQDQVRVAIGTESQDEFLTGSLAIYRANKYIQTLPKDSRIALYDEVFGFYVDRDYFWANPGHSMLIPYESMKSASDYVIAMRRLGFTHIYINLFTGDMRFPAAIGYGTDLLPYSEEERSAMMLDLDLRWKVLLADASAQGLIRPQATFGMSVVFSIDL